MLFCKHCGAELRPSARFCKACGTPVEVTQLMPTKPKRTLLVSVSIIVVVGLIGLVAALLSMRNGSTPKQLAGHSPTEVVLAGLNAIRNRNESAFRELLTDKGQKAADELVKTEEYDKIRRGFYRDIRRLDELKFDVSRTNDGRTRVTLSGVPENSGREVRIAIDLTETVVGDWALVNGDISVQKGDLVPVGAQAEVWLIREAGAWKLHSVGTAVDYWIEWANRMIAQDRLRKNEYGAIDTLRAIQNAEANYRWQRGIGAYGTLPDLIRMNLIDSALLQGVRNGYRFEVVPATNANGQLDFQAFATPQEYGKTGRRSFFLDSTGNIRVVDQQGRRATVNDPILNQ